MRQLSVVASPPRRVPPQVASHPTISQYLEMACAVSQRWFAEDKGRWFARSRRLSSERLRLSPDSASGNASDLVAARRQQVEIPPRSAPLPTQFRGLAVNLDEDALSLRAWRPKAGERCEAEKKDRYVRQQQAPPDGKVPARGRLLNSRSSRCFSKIREISRRTLWSGNRKEPRQCTQRLAGVGGEGNCLPPSPSSA